MQEDAWAAAGVREGEILADKYRVERVLGVGGMGVVVSARHVQLDERVAIKFLLPHMLSDPTAVQRFLREAKAAVRIKNEYVVRVFDVRTLPSGAPYMVMEFLQGGDLASWLTTRGAMPVEVAVDFVLQACVALAEAHAMGIVHRDLKPSNLFCIERSDRQLAIKVLDFGISKVTDASGEAGMAMTKTTAVMGSPLYMSPEQMRSSKDVDVRTDIWSLGVILFELLTAAPPFDGTTLTEVAVKVATEQPPQLRALRPDTPPRLEAAIAGCLQKDPRARYADVGQLAVALAEFASPRGRAVAERITGIVGADRPPTPVRDAREASANFLAPGPGTAAQTAPGVGRTSSEWQPRRKTALVGIGAAVAIVCGLGSALLVRALAHPAPAAATNAAVHAPEPTSEPPPPSTALASDPPAATIGARPSAEPSAVTSASAPPSAVTSASAPPPPEHPGATVKGKGAGQAPPPHVAAHEPSSRGAAPTHPTEAPPAPNCNPPYFIDAQGHRQYKPECL